ncbi:hypothetical protein FAES_3637 [Fibrella aestuarina BUZ 2]|uniref:Uncharacterized protein n=1 Tax=Fibrella aestuarina BUZ 2 TaxID=1166018 RepID=I0KBZ1_9BACT|nr:hypothetical protein [Fibrella aestuarina]CCH01644.1 hypothetical protein FAES_3637 [Fibrella aestuarina BUZ 2]
MSDSRIFFASSGRAAYLPGVQAVVSFKGMPAAPVATVGANVTRPVVKKDRAPGQGDVVYWGDDNSFPQMVSQRIDKNPIIRRGLVEIASLWVGGGVYASVSKTDDTAIDDAEIETFLASRSTKKYLRDSALAIATWWNSFPEFILSKDRRKVVQLHHNKTAYCRWGRMDEKTGELNRVYVSANWPEASTTDPTTISLPAVNPERFDLVDWVRSAKDYKYVYPLSFPSEDRSYYALAAWDAVRSSGWLDVLEAIPEFKKAAMQNQMTIRYHIEVPMDYWPNYYQEKWEEADFDGKMAIRDAFLQEVMDRLTGVKNAHKAVMTESWVGRDGKPTGVVIKTLDDKHKEGKYNEDYSEGVSQLLYALGLDPTMIGYTSGKEGGRSGGSDKREAFWIFLAKSSLFRDCLLELLDFVAEYNGWKARHPRLTFRFRDTVPTTLDTGHSTAELNTPAA